jgi:putative hemolysin
VGLAFLEDAIEEIIGPIGDEFDEPESSVRGAGGDVLELPGSLSLPEAAERLGAADLGDESDTIGGHVVAVLGRLARLGDELAIGRYRLTVAEVSQRRIVLLNATPLKNGKKLQTGPERDA